MLRGLLSGLAAGLLLVAGVAHATPAPAAVEEINLIPSVQAFMDQVRGAALPGVAGPPSGTQRVR